jgi:uroporphyrinogen III methyltransferase/synthase
VIVTGHRADCGEDPSGAWLRAAQGADTLVFLMGVQNLPRIVEQALAGGRNPATPVAIVQQGTTSAQKTIVGTLATIVELAAGVHPPAIIVIGEVVSKRDELRWFDHEDRRPLLGLGVLNTRPVREPCSIDPLSPFKREEFSQALMSLGAEPFEFPAYRLATAPLPDKFQPGRETHPNGNPKPPFDWIILSSPRAVIDFFESLIQSGCDARQLAGVKLAVVGEPAREALLQKGLAADYVFSDSSPAALAQSPGCFSGSRLFIPLDPSIDQSLLSRLRACGAQVESAGLYQSQKLEPDPGVISALLAEKIEVAAFFSPEDVDAVMNKLAGRGLESVFHNLTAACAGIETAQAAQQAGLKPEIIAQNAAIEGMVEEIRRWRKP